VTGPVAVDATYAAMSPNRGEVTALLDATPATIWIARDPECRVISGSRAHQFRLVSNTTWPFGRSA